MISSIIFDMDGVLIDSQSQYDIYEFIFFKQITNNRWTKQEQFSIQGMSIEDVYKLLVSIHKIELTLDLFKDKYNEILDIIYHNKCKLTTGVKDFLNDVVINKYKIGLASTTSHKYINKVIDKFKLRKYFQVIISGDDTNGKNKPMPDIFLLTAKKLGVKPKECIVIEDSDNGVLAANRAGMLCIQYVKVVNKNSKGSPDFIIDTFHNLKINQLLNPITIPAS